MVTHRPSYCAVFRELIFKSEASYWLESISRCPYRQYSLQLCSYEFPLLLQVSLPWLDGCCLLVEWKRRHWPHVGAESQRSSFLEEIEKTMKSSQVRHFLAHCHLCDDLVIGLDIPSSTISFFDFLLTRLFAFCQPWVPECHTDPTITNIANTVTKFFCYWSNLSFRNTVLWD